MATEQVKLSFGQLDFVEQECKNDFKLDVQKVSKWQIHRYISSSFIGEERYIVRGNVLSKLLAAPVSLDTLQHEHEHRCQL